MNARTFSAVLLVFLLGSCDETFSPKAPFVERPVVQYFVEGRYDSSMQRVSLTHLYDVPSLDPSANRVDPFIFDARVEVTGKRSTKVLDQDTLRMVTKYDSLRYLYQGRMLFYPGDPVSLHVTLPDGSTLSASTRIPLPRGFREDPVYFSGVTTRPTPNGARALTISWDSPVEGHLFVYHLMIPCQRRDTSGLTYFSVEMPLRLVNGKPVYPIPTTQTQCSFEYPAIDFAMRSIAGSDTNKSRYTVGMMVFQLVEYDEPLSLYYQGTTGSVDVFSIRAESPVYSNISGGLGILGSYFQNTAYYDLNTTYIGSFGYSTH